MDRLRETGSLLVAGGAHTTVRPDETLARGFDVALAGEAELSLVALVQALESGTPLTAVPGAHVRLADGSVARGPASSYLKTWTGWPSPTPPSTSSTPGGTTRRVA